MGKRGEGVNAGPLPFPLNTALLEEQSLHSHTVALTHECVTYSHTVATDSPHSRVCHTQSYSCY